MDIEQALEFVDTLVFAKYGKHLSDLQRLLFRGSWSEPRRSYDEIANVCGYSVNYLKQDAGPKLWQLLTDICGEKVSKTNFRAALERRAHLDLKQSSSINTNPIKKMEEIVPTIQEPLLSLAYLQGSQNGTLNVSEKIAQQEVHQAVSTLTKTISQQVISEINKRQDWGDAPDVAVFYDRRQELEQLEEWIVKDHCRLVAMLGMGGIGKTHFSVKLAEHIEDEFEYIIWRSLTHAPKLQQILTNLLQILTNGQETDLPASVDEKTLYLIDYLRKHRCLIILDNVETVLGGGVHAGTYKEGYEDYGNFLKRLGECRHDSCLVITSREKPKEIALMEGETLPVRSFKLEGLSHQAGLQLLQLKGCGLHPEQNCEVLIEKYAGNPLALKIVCAAIQELFEGNTSEFISQNTLVFDQIYDLLDQQFNRLSDSGKTFLYWLAINHELTSVTDLSHDIFPPLTKPNLIETINSLSQRSLIEKSGYQFSLQPAVREYLLNRFIESICQEIQTGDLDLFNSHALLKAEAKEYIRQIQTELIVKPLIGKLLAIFKNKNNLEARLRQIILKLQEQSPSESGYAPGNILNLFCHLQTDLTGYDFSHLTVWQAYLQNINLHNVNFADADLSKSVFAKQLTMILSVAFSPDGQLLATGDANGEVRLWQVADSKLLLICKGHAGWVHCVTFSPDGKLLSSASSDHTVKLWNVTDGKCIRTLTGHTQRVRSLAFSPDGKLLVSGSSDSTVRIWTIAKGQCLNILKGHKSFIWSVAFSPDGMMVASGSEDGTIKLWDAETGNCLKTLSGHTRWVRTVAFSPDSETLASGGGDRTVKLWDVSKGTCRQTLEGHTQRLRALAFSPDGAMLASGGGDHTVRLWDCGTGGCLRTLHGHSSRLTSVAFSPDGKLLASGGEDLSVRLWQVTTGQCLKNWQGYASWVQSVVFSPDGTILASSSEDRKVRLWNLEDTETKENLHYSPLPTLLEGHTGWVCSVAFSPNGKMLASASSDYSVKLWDVATRKCTATLVGHTRWIRSVAFSPDGKTVASCSGDYTVKLWDVATAKCRKTLQGHTGWLWSVAFSPDGLTVASASEDTSVRLWDVRTGNCLATFVGHNSWIQSVAFSPDGKLLASGSCDCTIRLWDLEKEECLKTFLGHNSWVQSVAFSPDGKTLASGSCDETVRLWDIGSRQYWKTLWGHTSWVWSVIFSPDGKVLATGSQDETIKLWDLNTGECLETLRSQRPYEGMCINKAKGLTNAQLVTLKGLGAITVDKAEGF